MFKKFLVPTDGSELSLKAVEGAIELAQQLGAEVLVWCGAEAYPITFAEQAYIDQTALREEARDIARRHAQAAAEKIRLAQVPCEVKVEDAETVWGGIIAAAEKNGCDLIFMSSHGRRGLAALLMGSETQNVLTHSTIPVLVYR